MKIRKLEIAGFKSFVDRTVVHFDHDVTGIVGPNGCGKSNVVDAIKWVMGEQSPSRLRGKAMDDVIFAGSANRGPHGFAEVSLTFDNTDGLVPPEYRDYAEITVSRRLDRDGRSDYLINKTPVRLLDITNLFLGTGVGRRAYSIIEQGRIGFIVSAKPADRRLILEEAAGITKYRMRKKASERKMEQTQQNLLRVGDIVGELERGLQSLKRQAQKAERYKRYREELRDLELYVASHKYLEHHCEHGVVRRELDVATASLDGKRLAFRLRETELEAERVGLDQVSVSVEQAQNRAYTLDNKVRVLEGQVEQQEQQLSTLRDRERIAERELEELRVQREALATERASLADALRELELAESEASNALREEEQTLAQRRAALVEAEQGVQSSQSRVAELRQRMARSEAVLSGYARRREETRGRIERLAEEQSELSTRKEHVAEQSTQLDAELRELRLQKERMDHERALAQTALDRVREEIRESDGIVERLRDDLSAQRSRLISLRELQARFEGVGDGVQALMTEFAPTDEARAEKKLGGLVADRIECPAELNQALAGVLSERLRYVVVDDVEAAMDAVRFLRGRGDAGGRATFVLRSLASANRNQRELRPELLQLPGVVGRLSDLVRTHDDDRELVRSLLGSTVVVKDLEAAKACLSSLADDSRAEGATFVTLTGDVISSNGLVSGGSVNHSDAHLLEMRQEISALELAVAKLDHELGAAVERHSTLRSSIGEYQRTLDSMRAQEHDCEIALVKAERDLSRARDEHARTESRLEQVAQELREHEASVDQAGTEEADALAELQRAKEDEVAASAELDRAQEECGSRRAQVEAQSARLVDIRVHAAQAQERAESDRLAIERLVRSIDELNAREARLKGDVETGAAEQGRIYAAWMLGREALHETVDLAKAAERDVSEARSAYEAAKAELGEHERSLKELRSEVDELAGRINSLTLAQRELDLAMVHLVEQVAERYRVDVSKMLGDYHARPTPDASVRARVTELTRLIERMGEINLTAIEEYEEKSTRYETLVAQQKDLEEAIAQLERAIRQMNRESRRLFREAFSGVNERFKRVYPMLFRGGRAELKLTDSDDLLESGVDIIAQPPGKRLGSLELMSGGEKALTAVALVFALFQYKPSPFCLLDEVDAPLDEANISRFAQAIRQMTDLSQFIVITHSKRTMEYTDVLYGVTMEQPGVSTLVSVELKGDDRPATEDPAAAVA